jgi:hypothetical protein
VVAELLSFFRLPLLSHVVGKLRRGRGGIGRHKIEQELWNLTAVLQSVEKTSPSRPSPRRWRSFKWYCDSNSAFLESDMSLAVSKSIARGGHSAAVRMELHVDGRILRPSHAAADYLIFREPQSIPPGLGRLVITIDGIAQESTLRILLQSVPNERINVEIVHQ